MTGPVRTVPAHGVSPEFLAAVRRHSLRRTASTFHEFLGGDTLCRDFARRVFAGVAADPVLRAWFAADPAGWERRLAESLAAYWRGTPVAGDPAPRWDGPPDAGSSPRWSGLVDAAVAAADLPDALRSALRDCFRLVAQRLVAVRPEPFVS